MYDVKMKAFHILSKKATSKAPNVAWITGLTRGSFIAEVFFRVFTDGFFLRPQYEVYEKLNYMPQTDNNHRNVEH